MVLIICRTSYEINFMIRGIWTTGTKFEAPSCLEYLICVDIRISLISTTFWSKPVAAWLCPCAQSEVHNDKVG